MGQATVGREERRVVAAPGVTCPVSPSLPGLVKPARSCRMLINIFKMVAVVASSLREASVGIRPR